MVKRINYAAASLNTKAQSLEMVHKIVGTILNHVGCGACGRIARLRIDLLSDPPPDLAKEGVISFEVSEVTGG